MSVDAERNLSLSGGVAEYPSTPTTRSGARLRQYEQLILGSVGVLLFMAAWQLLSSSGLIDPLIFASPIDSGSALVRLIISGELYPHLFASLRLLLVGLTVAVVSGTIVGFAAGWFRNLRGLLMPHVALFYSTPSVALMPLFLVFFGLGFMSQFAVVALLAFFPAYYAALDAVQTSDPQLLKVARSFTASDAKLFQTVILPGSVPLLLSGLRIALGKAVIGVIVAELYLGNIGLGYLINYDGLRFQTAEVFAVITLLALFGLLASVGFRVLERRFDNWRPHSGSAG